MKNQTGFALLLLLAVVVLVATYLFVNQLNAATSFSALRRDHNAKVLSQAKQALIGHVAVNAGTTGENDPGSFPCPEAPANYANPTLEGIAAGNCGAPAVGRLPWRTLGLDKLTDANGEPLWYVVSPAWHKPAPLTNTVINSNTLGQLSVDGAANDVVALIIAPGAPMVATAGPGCAAVSQARSTAGINVVNYLECDNATPADNSFVTTGPSASFNDQVLRITRRDALPAIEAAISKRIEREIVPAMRSVYASNAWGSNVSAANPFYPYAAPYANPGTGASYKGSAASCSGDACQGLLPVVAVSVPGAPASACTPSAAMPCDPNFVQWTGGTIEVTGVTVDGIAYVLGSIVSGLTWNSVQAPCSVATVGPPTRTELRCNARVPGLAGSDSTNVRYTVRASASNVGMAFRQWKAAGAPGLTITAAPSANANVSASGVATTLSFEGRTDVAAGSGNLIATALCGMVGSVFGLVCREVIITVPITLLGDPPFLDAQDPNLGWFTRNEWYRLLYYAAAVDVTPDRSSSTPNCSTNDDCLEIDGIHDKRALLLLAGRSLAGTVGHNRALDDFVDIPPNRDNGKRFETRPVNAAVNDRFVVVQND